MSDTNSPGPRPCCTTDFLLPPTWFESTDKAAERAARAFGRPVPIPRSQATAVFAGTEFMQPPTGFEQTWRSDLLWANGQKIRVAFRDDQRGLTQQAFDIAKEWCKYANLDFVLTNDFASADIRVTFEGEGFQSVLGRQSVTAVPRTESSMTLGFNKHPQPETPVNHVRRLVLHEFGHALGLEHEQAHRKSGIKWNEGELLKYLRNGLPKTLTDQQILDQVKLLGEPGAQWADIDYDLLSIMRYTFPRVVFAAGWDPAFDAENTELSEGDKKAISQMYPGRVVVGGSTGFEKQKKINAGDTVSDSIKQEKVHRYDFDAEDGNYEVTTEGPAVVRIELLTKDGQRPPSVTLNVSDATSDRFGARILAFIPAGGYYVTVRSSPFNPGTLGEGPYTLKLDKHG